MWTRIGLWVVIAGLVVTNILIRIDKSEMQERYRLLNERQDRLDAIMEAWPEMLEAAHARQTTRILAYLEGRDD